MTEFANRPVLSLTRAWALGALLSILAACSTIPTHKPLAPSVDVVKVKPLNLDLNGQRLAFTLRVNNPNEYDLPLRALQFTARLDGEHVADGLSNERVTIPANGAALVEVVVTAGLGRLIGKARRLLDGEATAVSYDVRGSVRLGNWPTPISFTHGGDADIPAR